MNRSFRGPETLMPSIKPRITPEFDGVRDREDDLALFLEMRKLEIDKTADLLNGHSIELNEPLVLEHGGSPLFDMSSANHGRKLGGDDFLNSDGDKNDYDWLLTPPGTPLFPSLEMESRKTTYMSEAQVPKGQPTALRSRLANSQTESTPKTNSRHSTGSAVLNSSVSGTRRPSSSNGSGSRPVTPTGRSTSTSAKPSRPSTPTSRATLSGAKSTKAHSSSPKPIAKPTASRPMGPTTPSKPTPSSKSSTPSRSVARPSAPSTGPSRSSTPTRAAPKSSTPTPNRSTVPAPRPTSRSSTPTRRLSTPSSGTAALNKSSSSISNKSMSAPSKNIGPSRGASPTVRSRPWNPSEMPGFSLDAPPNLRTTLPDRPLSATRGRPAAAARSASVEPIVNGRQRRQSCSPSRGGVPSRISGSSVPAVSRGHSRVNDDVSPVVMGSKMVERVVNMRKLVPPRHDEKHSPGLSGKSASSPDSSGFGRTLSKKSLDMAIRHMDIRRSIPGNLRPLMTKIPASSMYSVRTGPTGNRTASVSDSPVGTSSNASSEQSVNNQHVVAIDRHGSELDEDFVNERIAQISHSSLFGR